MLLCYCHLFFLNDKLWSILKWHKQNVHWLWQSRGSLRTSLHRQLEGLLHCRDLSGLLACEQCHGPHGLMETAVLPQAKGGTNDGRKNTETQIPTKQNCVHAPVSVCVCVCACCRGNYINASIVDKCVTQITATHVSEHRTCTHCSLWYNMWRELWKHGAASCSCKNLPNFSLASAWDTSANRIMDECFPSWVDFSVYYDLFSVKSRTVNSPLVLKIYILVTILLAICVEIFYVHLF